MAKRKRNYYKILFYLLLSLVVAYALYQGRKKEIVEQEYVNFRLAKKYCPAMILMAGHTVVVDELGNTHSEKEWFKYKSGKR